MFGCQIGEEKLEFHQAVFRLKEHLSDVPPIELNFEVNVNAPVNKGTPPDVVIYELPVYEYGGNHK